MCHFSLALIFLVSLIGAPTWSLISDGCVRVECAGEFPDMKGMEEGEEAEESYLSTNEKKFTHN